MLRLAQLYKVRLFVAHRVCDQTYIRLFIINSLLGCHFGKAVPKAVHDDDPSVLFR